MSHYSLEACDVGEDCEHRDLVYRCDNNHEVCESCAVPPTYDDFLERAWEEVKAWFGSEYGPLLCPLCWEASGDAEALRREVVARIRI